MNINARITFGFLLFLSACTQARAERLVLASASYGKNVVAICDSEGKVLWSHATAGPKTGHAGHHDIQLLDNGNLLFHDNWTTIIEMTLDKKIVWTYDSATMNGNKGKRVEVHAFQRLPNGLDDDCRERRRPHHRGGQGREDPRRDQAQARRYPEHAAWRGSSTTATTSCVPRIPASSPSTTPKVKWSGNTRSRRASTAPFA